VRHPKSYVALVILGGVLLSLSIIDGIRLITFHDVSWWTPMAPSQTLDASKDKVRVYLRGLPLESELAQNQVQLATPQGSVVLQPADFQIRTDNYDSARASKLPIAATAGVLFSLGACILCLGLLGWHRSTRLPSVPTPLAIGPRAPPPSAPSAKG
jgi:hypothetical protein